MFSSTGGASIADIGALMNGRNNGDGFGDGNGWWVLIILFALFGGWGRGGYGAGGGSGADAACATAGDVQRGFDTQMITSKLNGLENGICSLGYDQLAQMNGINSNIMQTGFGITNAISQASVANMQQGNALSTQLAQCCCENREGQAQIRYDMATDTCAITTAINQAAQNIIQNDNCNYRALHDELVQNRLDAKDEKIAEQQSVIQALNLAASQQAQNTYLINQLRPAAVPAYNVPNPYAYYGGCGFQNYSNGCCNGNFI